MPRESKENRTKRARRIARRLFRTHPDAHCELVHQGPFELLVATILSAQCTDKMVNKVTPELFRLFPHPARLAEADPSELERILKPTGFFRQKSRMLRAMAQALVGDHEGEVPKTLEDLTQLPGVGRKTANVVLGNEFGVPGIVVDTHVGRLSRRMGLSRQDDPVKVERDLMELFPPKQWTDLSHVLIFHGRRICFARNPQCELCPVADDCHWAQALSRREKAGARVRRRRTA